MVFVIDSERRPLSPCHQARARWLLSQRKAAVWRHFPFTIILTHAVPEATPTPLRLKFDPGSQVTGLALVTDSAESAKVRDTSATGDATNSTDSHASTDAPAMTGRVIWAAELQHRGHVVHAALLARRTIRRSRRQRHTRYRPARFVNRRRPPGWLPPSMESRIANIITWLARLRCLCPISALSLELVRFDTQLMRNAEISGVEYKQGTLVGYEVREYLLEKWARQCAYCHTTQSALQIEHIVPKSRGGSDGVSNLTIACEPCNQAKGTHTAEEFGHPDVQAHVLVPLRDAAAVNTTRWTLYQRLQATGLPVETGTGGRTKWNRTVRGLGKARWTDAACVGASTPERLVVRAGLHPLVIEARGRESRQMCRMDRCDFPRSSAKGARRVQGFQTGDLVRAVVRSGAQVRTYAGRVAVRARGSFNIRTAGGTITDIPARSCKLVQRADGYAYRFVAQKGGAALPLAG